MMWRVEIRFNCYGRNWGLTDGMVGFKVSLNVLIKREIKQILFLPSLFTISKD